MYNNTNSSRPMENDVGLSTYISKVFGTMFLGLLVTAVSAYLTATSQTMINLLYGKSLIYLFMIGELVIVFSLSLRINKISYATSQLMFYLYAIVNGITLSAIFFAYSVGTIYSAFLTASISFGVMAIYGMVTKKDLTRIGNVLIMLLFGVIIASFVNIFLGNQQFDLVISFVAVALFVGLVAYDTQKLKSYYYMSADDYQLQKKIGIMGALSLYLDFINIFLRLLRIFGNRRD